MSRVELVSLIDCEENIFRRTSLGLSGFHVCNAKAMQLQATSPPNRHTEDDATTLHNPSSTVWMSHLCAQSPQASDMSSDGWALFFTSQQRFSHPGVMRSWRVALRVALHWASAQKAGLVPCCESSVFILGGQDCISTLRKTFPEAGRDSA